MKKITIILKHLSHLFGRKCFDWKYNPIFIWILVLRKLCTYIMRYRRSPKLAFYNLLIAHNLLIRIHTYPPASRCSQLLERMIKRELAKTGHSFIWHQRASNISVRERYCLKNHWGIILKAPRFVENRIIEKGAILLKYGSGFNAFAQCTELSLLLQDYVLILEPGWSGYANPTLLPFTSFSEHPIIVMATEIQDYQFLTRLQSNLIPVRFGASDWANPSIFKPTAGIEKRYDAVMVAKWARFKRHHILFQAIQRLRDTSFRLALVALSFPPYREEIETLLDIYHIRPNVRIFEDLSQQELNKILNQSKVNILLSLQEGSNRSLFEGFFAGVPGLALKNSIGLQKDYFTPQTGKLIKEKNLGAKLLYFREHWPDFNPRTWALANISPEKTTGKLNTVLKELAKKRGEQWTCDIVAKYNAPNLAYYPDERVAKDLPTMADILKQYQRSDLVIEG